MIKLNLYGLTILIFVNNRIISIIYVNVYLSLFNKNYIIIDGG